MCAVSELVSDDLARLGFEALARHDWKVAYDRFVEASGSTPPEGRTLSALAEAAWWTGRLDESIVATERAYEAYMAAGNVRAAGAAAMDLARDYASKRKTATSAGWAARSERLLEDHRDSPEFGRLLVRQSSRALEAGRPDEAIALSREAVEIGTRLHDRDCWALAVHKEGQALLAAGRIAEGMLLIDEATAAAVGGELSARTTGLVYCWTIASCRDLADYSRAGEWTEAASRWCERQSINGFPGVCRIHRAELLRLRGSITQAETEIRRACDELFGHPSMNGYAFAELGEIRLRVGDLEGAQEAFRMAHELGDLAEPGHSLLLLAQGRSAAATASIRRALGETRTNAFETARLLPAAVEIGLAAGEREWADASATALEKLADQFGSVAHRAAALQGRGAVQLAAGSLEEAGENFRSAIRGWQEVDAPYEIARCRELLAAAYRSAGDRDGAGIELHAAQSSMLRLGARVDADRVTAQLAASELGDPVEAAVRTFMFTDIVESTALLEAIGDEAWTALLRWHDEVLRSLFKADGGEEVDHAGDGFFVAFADSTAALGCARAIQRALQLHRREHGFAPRVRIGLHAGGARRTAESYKGRGVHQAARIAALAQADEILASAATLAGVPLPGARTVNLKGFTDPVTVCPVDWR